MEFTVKVENRLTAPARQSNAILSPARQSNAIPDSIKIASRHH